MFTSEKKKTLVKDNNISFSSLGNQSLLCLVKDSIIQRSGSGFPSVSSTIATTKEVAFAGGPHDNLQVASYLVAQHGGTPDDWYHWRGEAQVDDGTGTVRRAEVHWFQKQGDTVRYSMKVKRWLR